MNLNEIGFDIRLSGILSSFENEAVVFASFCQDPFIFPELYTMHSHIHTNTLTHF